LPAPLVDVKGNFKEVVRLDRGAAREEDDKQS
jgi:hypothetical protein